jgi:hypothetical protein
MSDYNLAKSICIAIFNNTNKSINSDVIKQAVENASMIASLSDSEKENLYHELEESYAIFSDEYKILDDQKTEPWIKNAKSGISWNFWNRYKILLEQKNFASDTINKLDELTDDILDRLVQPGGSRGFDKRGLIVGHVQSGKTSNFIGLICKAADAGYKLIVVLAGVHNSLRSQTQLRIDEGFLGFDTKTARNFAQTNNRIGVGRITPDLAAHSLTTNEVNGDFNRRASEISGINIRGNDPIILVIKKNVSVMKNLLGWLASRGDSMSDGYKYIKNLPLLVIDDEADNGSINISKNYVSGINACVRSLLKLFDQSAYIGYTATPYANIFIPQNNKEDSKGIDYSFENIPIALGGDIFPRNFIVNIPPPSNYFGPEQLFGFGKTKNINSEVKPVKLYRIVDDYESYIKDAHKRTDPIPKKLPPSLNYAIKCFFLSCAARRSRGQVNVHNSMLVHVSRFIDWQDKIADLVLNEVKDLAWKIEKKDIETRNELEKIWVDEYIKVTKEIQQNPSVNDHAIKEVEWSEIYENLYAAIAKIEVRAIHGDTRIDRLKHKNIKPLDYYDQKDSGLSVIAIGGNKLSRGLTLEGLTISYFLRASKMYDTLMQMGRWFGYRPGYLDLCRLFTSEELIEWYQHITIATDEMRYEFDRMIDLRKTPADYGLKVRTHKGVLTITAANKFRYKKIMSLSFSGDLEETYSFRKNDDKHKDNYYNTIELINQLGLPDGPPNSESHFNNHYVWLGVDNFNHLISYLNNYYTIQPSFNVSLITEYIQAQTYKGNLRNWTIAIINNSDDKSGLRINDYVKVGLTKRTDNSDLPKYYIVPKSHIIDPKHEYIDLNDNQIRKAMDETYIDAKVFNRKNLTPSYPNPVRIKSNRPNENGLLLIYFLNPQPDPQKPSLSDYPIIALAISFPSIDDDEKILYAVNEQFLKDLNYAEELDDDLTDNEELVEKSEEDIRFPEIVDEIRKSSALNLKLYIEIKKGVKVTYSKNEKLRSKSFIALPENIENSIPLIRGEELNKYYINDTPEFWVKNSEGVYWNNKDYLIGSSLDNKQAFGIKKDRVHIDENCIAVYSDKIQIEYLLAIFNSALFAFWSRQNRTISNHELVRSFPIKLKNDLNTGLIAVVRAINTINKNESSRETRIMTSFFMNVIDIAIFELYFQEDFKNNNLSVLKILDTLPGFEVNVENIKNVYSRLNHPQSQIKKAIYEINSINKFQQIYQSLQ